MNELNTKIKAKKLSKNKIKYITICLFLIMILICVIGGYLFNLGITSNYWILTILIPLPIVTIIFSILSRKNNMKNIGKHSMFMAGIASMVILIATLMLILFSKYEKRDYGLVTRIENEIAFVLPDEGTIFTTDFSTRKDAKYKTLSKIKFANNYEISSFEESIENYDYVVCDECHYFFEDASFNRFTDIIYKKIQNYGSVKIYAQISLQVLRE